MKVPYQGPDEDVTLVICGSITSPSSCFQPLIYSFLRLCILSTQNELRVQMKRQLPLWSIYIFLLVMGQIKSQSPDLLGAGSLLSSVTLTADAGAQRGLCTLRYLFFELLK